MLLEHSEERKNRVEDVGEMEDRGPVNHDHVVDFILSVPEGNPLESFKQKNYTSYHC